MSHNVFGFIREHVVLITVTIILLILIFLFHEIMTPFIIALIVVYLIEPMVARMNKIHIGKFHLPRGVAVICAYIIFLVSVTGFGFLFIPALTSEISRATEQLPQFLERVRSDEIPRISQSVDEMLFKLSRKDSKDVAQSVEEVREKINESFERASADIDELTPPSIDTSGEKPLLVAGERPDVPSARHKRDKADNRDDGASILFTLRQNPKGEFEVRANQAIVLESGQNGSYILKPKTEDKAGTAENSFNLERELKKSAIEFVESSTQYAGSALSFLQNVIEFVINAFIQFILVFMLAAFISIDSPRLMRAVHKLFESSDREAKLFEEYKQRLGRGLSGVVRGQLIICCINGTLTGLGLAFLQIDYALLLGIIAGVLSIVPIFGTIISSIPAVLLGLVKGVPMAGCVLLVIIIVHLLDTNIFTPKIVGSSSNLHPVIIIFALLAGQMAAGILGLVLAVPVASIIQTTLNFIVEHARAPRNSLAPAAAVAGGAVPAAAIAGGGMVSETLAALPNAGAKGANIGNSETQLMAPVARKKAPVSASSSDNQPKVQDSTENKPEKSDLPVGSKTLSGTKAPSIVQPLKASSSQNVAVSKASSSQNVAVKASSSQNVAVKKGISPSVKTEAPSMTSISEINQAVKNEPEPIVKKMQPAARITLEELCSIEGFASSAPKDGDDDDTISMDDTALLSQAVRATESLSGEETGVRARSVIISKGTKS